MGKRRSLQPRLFVFLGTAGARLRLAAESPDGCGYARATESTMRSLPFGIEGNLRCQLRPWVEVIEPRLLLSTYSPTTLSYIGASPNGSNPDTTLVADANGNFFGTTDFGGTNGAGTIFELARGTNSLTTLASFGQPGQQYSGAQYSNTSLTIDASGNLFGINDLGVSNIPANVYELPRGSNTITTLASFGTTYQPSTYATLTLDASDDLYGTTVRGGTSNDGTVFEIASGSNNITTLASFAGTNGVGPVAGVTFDTAGNLYGTTQGGGANNDGTVFELPSGSSTITSIASFNGANGKESDGQLTLDAAGDLYGT